MKFPCEICGYVFGRSYHLNRHKLICKPPEEKKKIYSCNACGKEYSMEKIFLKHKKNCNENKLNILHKKIDKMSLDITELKAQKPINQTIINNITNNKYVQNNMVLYGMEPLDLSQERFDEIVDKDYTYQVYTSYGIVDNVFLKFFSNDEGKVCVMLSDRDRMRLKCIDKNVGITYHDPKSIVGMCKSSEPLKVKSKEHEEKFTTNVLGEPNTVNIVDADNRRKVISNAKDMKRVMTHSSEKFLKKQLNINNLIDEEEE
jgi:hypothetical protein